jgi:hypothetical protein
MRKHRYLVTYAISFNHPKEMESLTVEKFQFALFNFLEAGHLLLSERDEETFGVENGSVKVLGMTKVNNLIAEYQVEHELLIAGKIDAESDVRVANYLAEALGIPQSEGPWCIKEFSIKSVISIK